MFQKLRKSRLALSAMIFIAIAVMGYFSNSITLSACELSTTRWLDDRLARSQSNWPERHTSSKPAHHVVPWIVGVNYAYVAGPKGGEWGTRYYVTVLGLHFPVRNKIRRQS